SSRRRHTRLQGDWSSDVCSSDLTLQGGPGDDRFIGFTGADVIDGRADSGYVFGGQDQIVLTATSADLSSASDSQIVNVETIWAIGTFSSITIDLHNQTEGFLILSGFGSDTLTGSAGNDVFDL